MTTPRTGNSTELSVCSATLTDPVESGVVKVAHKQGILVAKPLKPCPHKEDCFDCSHSFHPHQCQYKNIRHRVSLFNNAAIPARFQLATIEKLEQSLIKQRLSVSMEGAIRWILTWICQEPLPSRGMVLCGGYGTGKTFMMAALIRYLTFVYAIPCLLLDCRQFLATLKQCFNSTKNEHTFLERICDIDVLVLDDLGSTLQSQWSTDVFGYIIAKRYNAVASTFITTKFNQLNQIRGWLSEHSISRLKEMCSFFCIEGSDRRDQGQGKSFNTNKS